MPVRSALLVAALCAAVAACAPSASSPRTSPSKPPAPAGETIQHLVPARDSSGAAPTRFEWTAVAGADSYAINIFNEIDIPVWQQDGIREPRVVLPADLRIEGGTYFWAVAALKDDRPIAQSGRAAFVVLR